MILTEEEEKHFFSAFEQAMSRRGILDKPHEVTKFLLRLLLGDVAGQRAEIDSWMDSYHGVYDTNLNTLDARMEVTRTVLNAKKVEVETLQARIASERR